MHKKIHRAALAVPVLAALLALGACSDRGDPNEMTQRDQPSVEINRHGMKGAGDLAGAETHRGATAIMGGVGNGAPEGGVALDARIATEVKQALQRDAALSGMGIDVSSQDGLVTLHGRAADPAARDRADQVARGVKDVKSVENQLTLG
ncbi:BON domain-containing protein [Ramlibacter sp. PS3R-8]|uniref:BON domain-containing protein n=1 Tax=Ramlibacter sp. PS3R-8 TaxID=3133437 RepID=UPI0030A07940